MKIKKPIFIVGVGRSGSTVFYEMFSEHPNVTWLSGVVDRYPDKPSLNRFGMKAIDYPLVGRFMKRIATPGERYSFWEHHCKGFRHPCRDLLPGDVTNRAKAKIPSVLSEMLTNKRNRLLFKITGWPRIGFLHEIFNDAKFIHIVRDGRAVVNSRINWRSWWGWRGPQNWRWGELVPSQKEEWEKYDRSFVALASIEWKILLDAMERAKRFIDEDNFMEVKYGDLCFNPVGVFKEVSAFCDLEWSQGFEETLERYPLKNTNHKWKKELSTSQQNIVKDILGDYLKNWS